MRTTNKLFKELVREHILHILGDVWEPNNEDSLVKQQLQQVADEFNNYYYRGNIQDSFVDFCRGLPSVLHVEYMSYEIDELLAKWFEAIDQDYDPERLEDNMEFYCCLIHRELKYLFKQYKVDGGLIQ